MATRADQRDHIIEWFGEGSPGWIASLAWAIAWLVLTAWIVIAAIIGSDGLRWDQVLGLSAFLLALLLPAVAVPVLVIDAVVALVGRQMGWRVGEAMVAVPVVWTVTVAVWWSSVG